MPAYLTSWNVLLSTPNKSMSPYCLRQFISMPFYICCCDHIIMWNIPIVNTVSRTNSVTCYIQNKHSLPTGSIDKTCSLIIKKRFPSENYTV